MTLVGIASALEQVEALTQPRVERIGREKLRARGSELERKRQSIEARAEPSNRVRGLDVRADCTGALDEERHSIVVHERWQVELVLTGDSQGFATRDEEPDGRGCCGQLPERTGDIGEQVLEVVDDHVRSLVTDPRSDCRDIPGRCAEPFADRREDERRLAQRGERAEHRPAFRFVGEQAAELDCESRLARSPGPENAQHPRVVLVHERDASNSSRSRPRKRVAGTGSSTLPRRAQRRELAPVELREPDRAVEVLEPMQPEVAQLVAVEKRCGRG